VAFGEETFKRALRGELAVHSSITDLKVWVHGVDAHFMCSMLGVDLSRRIVDASRVWSESGIVYPRDARSVGILSRNDFRYPQLTVYGKLPRLQLVGNETFQHFWVGFENGFAGGNSLVAFQKVLGPAGLRFNARWYDHFGWVFGKDVFVDITPHLPPDNETVDHQYVIRLHRNIVIYEIDGRIVAIAIPCNRVGVVKSGVKPYSIMLVERVPERISVLIEWGSDRTAVATTDLYAGIEPRHVRVSEGPQTPTLDLPLYLDDSDVRLAGHSSTGSVVSHPFPVLGFNRKTLYFMSDTTGTLEVQVYTVSGNWRTYDSISIPANTLLSYTIDDEAVLARAVFTPSAYPASILEAEVVMS